MSTLGNKTAVFYVNKCTYQAQTTVPQKNIKQTQNSGPTFDLFISFSVILTKNNFMWIQLDIQNHPQCTVRSCLQIRFPANRKLSLLHFDKFTCANLINLPLFAPPGCSRMQWNHQHKLICCVIKTADILKVALQPAWMRPTDFL